MSAIGAVVFDLSGTVVDLGSRGPVVAFLELFRRYGVTVSEEAARAPMGAQKRDHIVAMFAREDVREAWRVVHGRDVDEATLDRMYADFLPLQIDVLKQHSEVLPGVVEMTHDLRARGIRLATTTGFDSRMMVELKPRLMAQGFEPDLFVTPDLVGEGRPAPWMIHHAMRQLNLYPCWRVVKVGDTEMDVAEGLNAGVWVVAVTATGNEMGKAGAWEKFMRLGAHYTVESAVDLPPVIDEINRRLSIGERP